MTDSAVEALQVLGSAGVRETALVDAGGGVRASGAGWCVQWFIRSEQRWHQPIEQLSTRQEIDDGSAAVTTRVRVPSGDISATVWVALDSEARPHARLEIANTTTVPVGIALVVRGDDEWGPADADRVEVSNEGMNVGSDRVVVFDREPRVLLAADDVAGLLDELDADATPSDAASAASDGGLAACAAVFPVAHGATLSASIALRRGTLASPPTVLPTAAAVAQGWEAHLDRGVRLVTGDALVDSSLQRARRQLLVSAGDGVPAPWPGLDPAGHAQLRGVTALALAQWGFTGEAQSVCAALAADFDDGRDDVSVASAWLLAAEACHRLAAGDLPTTESIAMAVSTIDMATRRPRRRQTGRAGLVHVPGAVEPWGFRHSVWSIVGLRSAAASLIAHGQPDAAEQVGSRAHRLARCWNQSTPPDDPSRELMAALGALATPSGVPSEPAPVLSVATTDPLALAVALVALPRRFVEVTHDGFDVVAPPVQGANWELHDLPSAHGPVSLAIRWHGERPALLWEHHGGRLTARSIDPSWSTVETPGEALLEVLSL